MSLATDSTTGSTDRLAAFLLGLPALGGDGTETRSTPAGAVLFNEESSGERLVSHLRLLVATGVLLLELAFASASPGHTAHAVLAGVFWVAAAGVHFMVTRRYAHWLAFLSCALDVTVVSAVLALSALGGRNEAAGFELYFLAIGCAGLRYDWRLTGLAGLLAVVQYAGVTALAWLGAPDASPALENALVRLLVLAAATAVSTAVVVRAKRLRRLSNTDPLTGLSNRAAFAERLAGELQRARRHGRPLSVAVLDVDHFKRFNDSHGHPAGDDALRVVARTLRLTLRQSDLVARLGGEEFGLILTETPPAVAIAKVDAVRQAVADAAIPVPRRWMPQYVTLSGGVAGRPDDAGLGAAGLVALADERLYAAKDAGRDRVIGPPRAALRGPSVAQVRQRRRFNPPAARPGPDPAAGPLEVEPDQARASVIEGPRTSAGLAACSRPATSADEPSRIRMQTLVSRRNTWLRAFRASRAGPGRATAGAWSNFSAEGQSG